MAGINAPNDSKTPVSDLADEFKIQPSQIHAWVKQVLDRAEAAFVGASDGPRRSPAFERNQQQRIAELELKLARKHEVISELMEANLQGAKAAQTPPGAP